MPRLARLHRVVGIWPDGRKRTRNYLTPEAAEERRERWEQANPDGSPSAAVTVQASYPVTFPSIASDRFDIPDMVLERSAWHDLLERLGIKPEAVRSISVTPDVVAVQYDPDPDHPGKREPQTWTIHIENEETP